jgi:hypothetical protein
MCLYFQGLGHDGKIVQKIRIAAGLIVHPGVEPTPGFGMEARRSAGRGRGFGLPA